MSSNYDQASVKTHLSEHGQNSALMLVGVLADPKSLFRGLVEFQEFQVKIVCAYVFRVSFSRSYNCSSLRRKGLSTEPLNIFLVGPSREKHFQSLRCRFALGLSQGRKVYDSQGSWQH